MALLNVPAGHTTQASSAYAPASGPKVPAGHCSQTAAPPTAYVPAAHADMSLADVVDGHANPGGHGVHCVDPASAKEPGTQTSISVPSAFGHAVPAGQMEHVAFPPRA